MKFLARELKKWTLKRPMNVINAAGRGKALMHYFQCTPRKMMAPGAPSVSISYQNNPIDKMQVIEMIEQYTTASHMTVQRTKYYQDLKIIQGDVKDNWWRKEGHRLNAADISDILSAKPDVLVIGTGYAGNMRVPVSLRTAIEGQDIKVIVEKTSEATKTFNRLFTQGKDVAGAFHLTC
jgi:hypothetical protein